jgi:hypothetical protein
MVIVAHHRNACILVIPLVVLACRGRVVAADEKPVEVPLKRVVLFNSGLGFFQHQGELTGDQTIELKFKIDDVNDLLKSMVVEDLGSGRISTVTYAAREPVTRTLKTFAIDLTRNPTLAELLRQVRGEKIQADAPNPIIGTIVGIERRRVKSGKDETAEIEMLNLLTAAGLRSIPLESIVQTQLLDPKLNGELQDALAVLAKAHRSDKKSVTLSFLGNGKRTVRIGYIQEFPVWKTSYRLVVKDDGSLFLQGWAIVENMTEQDWHNVAMTLVSGQPISFVEDLYQPLYVDRPLVIPDAFASLTPRVYEQDLAAKETDFRRAADSSSHVARRNQAGGGLGGGGGFGGGGGGGFGGGIGGGGPAAGGNDRPFVTSVVPVAGGPVQPVDTSPAGPGKGINPAAQGGDVGELFRYVITEPVTLARQKSAMLPIVNDSVKGEKLSIYNASVHPKHPLNGLRLVNSTVLHLMQGPITVFDGGEYAGDARIEDLQPGTERLLSYALDLDTEVAPGPERSTRSLAAITIADGSLIEDHLIDRTRSFVVKNSGPKTKKLLIEYPRDADWTLTAPKEPAEKTRDLYRFAVKAEPGKPANLEIVQQRIDRPEVAVSKLPEFLPSHFDDKSASFTSAVRERTSELLANVKINQGNLTESRTIIRSRRYTIRNPSSKAINLPVNYAVDPQWVLVSPDPPADERHGFYHFQVQFEPDKPSMLEVIQQRTVQSTVPLSRLDDEQIKVYANAKTVGPDVKAALDELVKRRQALAGLAARKAQLERQIKEVGEEQGRIRQNMSQLERNSELYNRYVKKFGVQEDEVEKLRQQLRELSVDVEGQRKSLGDLYGNADSVGNAGFDAIAPSNARSLPENPFGTPPEKKKDDDPFK